MNDEGERTLLHVSGNGTRNSSKVFYLDPSPCWTLENDDFLQTKEVLE